MNLKNNIGFDLGTNTFRVYQDGKLVESINVREKKNDELVSQKLISAGKISNFYLTEQLLNATVRKFQKVSVRSILNPLTSIISVPSDFCEVSLRSFRDVVDQTNVKKCFMLFDSFIAANGLEIDLKNTTSMIVDCGAGKTSITIIRNLSIIKNDILQIGGNDFDNSIQSYIGKKYNLDISTEDAENLKNKYANLNKVFNNTENIEVKGKDRVSKSPKLIMIQSIEITDCIIIEVELIIKRVIQNFNNLDETTREGISRIGIHLIGGSFKLKGLIERIKESLPVSEKSFKTNLNYMEIGFEKVQSFPDELEKIMLR